MIPYLKKRFEFEFGKNGKTVFEPDKCKECVAEGALQIYKHWMFGGREPDRSDRFATTAFGIAQNDHVTGKPAFHTIIKPGDDLDQWHETKVPMPGIPQLWVYEKCSPGAPDHIDGNSGIMSMGTVSIPAPKEDREGPSSQEPVKLRVRMCLEREGRNLRVRVGDHDEDITLDRSGLEGY
jgi:hypothetical protein